MTEFLVGAVLVAALFIWEDRTARTAGAGVFGFW